MRLLTSIRPVRLTGIMLLALSISCKAPKTNELVPPSPTRTLLKSTLIGKYSVDQLRGRYTGITAIFRVLIWNPVSVYRLEYQTTNTDGRAITASGAVIIPDVKTAAPLLSMQHGTISNDQDAPSYYGSGSEAYTFGSIFGSQGYIVSAPDYIGYGASKQLPHTYDQRSGLATASLDMLRATREFLTDINANWDKRVFLAGYSEGGYATMALQKKIEEETADEFNLVASSCGAGAYDKPAFMRQVVNGKTSGVASINKLYIWVLLTYDRIYGLNRPMSYYFKEPYASQIQAKGIEAPVEGSLDLAFTDSFKRAIQNETDLDFLKAVRDNDIHDWKPRTPLQLYHGDADNIVLFLNSQNTYDAMRKRGATNVTLHRLPGRDHATGLIEYILGTYSFFGEIQ